MRFIALVLPIVLLLPGHGHASTEEALPLPSVTLDEVKEPAVELTKAERIDKLFETLTTSKDERAAKEAERSILRLWLESDSDTVDLLMNWALGATQEQRYPRALDFLDRVIVMKPDYAEGWNKRATVHFLMEDYSRSLADIGQVLALEPRHFGALSGFGMIMRALGEDERAMTAYREALAVDPYLDNVQEALDELEAKDIGESL
ncbi:hypothetical protein [Bauldia litoralis]|uniref:Uncharacterized protein n=1 Tax=Bauldia litoralis TaxID=665467 RepID=A0A1G6A456_9HYPH|nr:hypothetical protein [Bauldia litoralis]SDB03192.1 hypothetical protein SAMN02982931_00150 [Bauldia litoralis]